MTERAGREDPEPTDRRRGSADTDGRSVDEGSERADAHPRPTAGPGDARRASTHGPPAPVPCDRCGASMIERHCKLVCRVCGYQRDCSDP